MAVAAAGIGNNILLGYADQKEFGLLFTTIAILSKIRQANSIDKAKT